jgi:PAS domain S-box-containing protein
MGVEAGSFSALEPILDLLPAPLLLVEPGTARVVYANRAAAPLAEARAAEEQIARVARGERFADVPLEWDTPEGRRSLRATGDTIETPGGGRLGVVSFEDVTDVEAARRRSELLAHAGPLLAASLDFDETLAEVGRLTVPAFADWCFVELLQPDGSIERSVIAHADPSKQAFAEEYDRRYPLDPDAPAGSAHVIRTGEAELIPDMPDDMLAAVAQDAEQLELLRGVGFRSALIVPMRARGKVIGDLALACSDSGRRYGPDDLPVVQELADRCALALENARLYTELSEAEAGARRAGDELRTILGGAADAVTAQAPDGTLVYANEAAVKLLGFGSQHELLTAPLDEFARRFEILDERGNALPLDRLPGRRALAGEEPEPLMVRYRAAGDSEARWSRVKSSPVFDESGAVRLAINVIEDITEIKRSEEAQRFLAESGRVLAGSLDYGETLATVAQLAVPEIADWCGVDVVGEDGLERVAVAHVDPEKVRFAKELAERYPADLSGDQGVGGVLRNGRSELYPEIPDEMLVAAARDPEHLELLRSLGMRAAMIVPMTVHGTVFGVMTFVSAEAGRSFGASDLELAESLALRAGAAVENARLYRARSAIAHTLQASLLPPALPDVPRLELAAAYRAAGEGFDVGGDFYDVFGTTEDQWYALVGDVCGKGSEAAAVTAMARYTIRAAAVRRRSPASILRTLSEAMLRQDDGEAGSGRFCTIACVHLDLARETVRATVACGGHPLPAILRADGSVEELGSAGTLLGLVESPDLHDVAGELNPGDTLVLYTDGLTEAAAPERVWTPEELLETLRGAAGLPARGVVEHLMAEAIGSLSTPRDDIAVLALRAR